MKLVLLLCYCAMWPRVLGLLGSASLGSVACLYRRRATEPTIWCNAKGQPATCQGSRHRARSPWPLARPGNITSSQSPDATWVTAMTGGAADTALFLVDTARDLQPEEPLKLFAGLRFAPAEALGPSVRLRGPRTHVAQDIADAVVAGQNTHRRAAETAHCSHLFR